MRSSILVAALALALAAPSSAHAFADASQFFANSANPHAATFGASGEGLYFTGAPRFASLDCSSCHADGPQKVGLQLNADDDSLFSAGYQPGKTYELQIELTNESEGLTYKTPTCTDPPAPGDTFTYVQCNNNGFGLEIDDDTGAPLAGSNVFCPQEPTAGMCPPADFTKDQALVAPDGDAVFDAKVYSADPNMPKLVTRNGADTWHFFWTAPKAGTGPLTVYVAAVDGNGGAGTVANDQDPYDDDTVAANFFLQEFGAPVHDRATAGGSLAPAAAAPSALWLVWPLALLALRMRQCHRAIARSRGSRTFATARTS
ncbi:MAG TPA: hypothetical protein VGL86_31475 [Polyangia bacterium]